MFSNSETWDQFLTVGIASNLQLNSFKPEDVPARYKTSLRSMSHPERKMSTTEYNDVMRAM
jgi:hypothetical protein